MTRRLHIDVETYSSEELSKTGAYKYCESFDFEILIVAYAFDNGPILVIDLAQGEDWPSRFLEALRDLKVEKHAHNATFERLCFKAYGFDIPPEQWHCTQIKSAYSGLPLALDKISKALDLGSGGKDSAGKQLINYFSKPVKPTKINGGRFRNFPSHNLSKWEAFKQYCAQDVTAERIVGAKIEHYIIPDTERELYILDQCINDRGVLVDLPFAKNASDIHSRHEAHVVHLLKEKTGLDNPNSLTQLKKWLAPYFGREIESLNKEVIQSLLDEVGPQSPAFSALNLRAKLAKTSVAKYRSMRKCACDDDRIRGLFQFYGAHTLRWSGRLVQLQNLPQNHIKDLSEARWIVSSNDYTRAVDHYHGAPDLLSQLIRTALIAPPGKILVVADFSAIEARVIAWLAGEQWRLDVFNSHGKIYEASASKMFNVPIEEVTKGSTFRAKGKIAELALGYQGAKGALTQMGGAKMGLSEPHMDEIVAKWRDSNKSIVALWEKVQTLAIRAVKTKRSIGIDKGLQFSSDGESLRIELPSGRSLYYREPRIGLNKWDRENIQYKGVDSVTQQWRYIDTYGGRLVENIVQAIARDLLAWSMLDLEKKSHKIIMHVHDEVVIESPIAEAEAALTEVCEIMSEVPNWAEGLPLGAEGYVTPFYKKD